MCMCRRALRRAPPRKRNSLASIAEGDEEDADEEAERLGLGLELGLGLG